METEEQIKQHKYSTAESFVSLSIGLWVVALIGYQTSVIPCVIYFLAVVGVISVLLSGYLILPLESWNRRQRSVFEFLKRNTIIGIVKLLVWSIMLVLFGVSLIQTGVVWLILTGLITFIIPFIVVLIVFAVGIRKPKHA